MLRSAGRSRRKSLRGILTSRDQEVKEVTVSEDPVRGLFEVKRLDSDSVPLEFIAPPTSDEEGVSTPDSQAYLVMTQTMDSVVAMNDILGVMSPPVKTDWLIASNKVVYMRAYEAVTSEPFLGLALTSEYLNWPAGHRTLPSLFMPLAKGPAGMALVSPNLSHVEMKTFQEAEELAFSLSPPLPALFANTTFDPTRFQAKEGDLYFTTSFKSLKRAIAYYHDSLGKESRVLSYFHNMPAPSGADIMLLKFEMPDILMKSGWPTVKGTASTVRLCLYCRNYIRFEGI